VGVVPVPKGRSASVRDVGFRALEDAEHAALWTAEVSVDKGLDRVLLVQGEGRLTVRADRRMLHAT